MILAQLRQIGIEETEGMRRFDDANARGALLIRDLVAEGLHSGPMDLWPEMMFGVVAIKEPDPVIELVVAAHAPGDRFIGIAAVMAVVTIQVGEAMAEIPKAAEENNVMPVQDAERGECAKKENDLDDAPISFSAVFTPDTLKNGFGIVAEKAEEHVAQRMLGFAVMPMFVDRKPVDRLAVFVGPVRVSLVMLHVNAIVEGLAETVCDRFEKGKEAVEEPGTEVGVVNEIVGDAVDVPGDADGIKEAEDQHDPERHARKKEEHPEEIGEMQQLGRDGDHVPAGECKNLRISLEPLGGDVVNGVHGEEIVAEIRLFARPKWRPSL
jgi:hypothetical protein